MQHLTAEQIQQEAERRYPLSKYWPKNRDGEPIEMRVGQTGLPGSKKAREEQSKFVAGATWAIQQLSSPDKTAEERAKELYPDTPPAHPVVAQAQQAAYLTGRKETPQQPASPLTDTPQQPVRECWVEVPVSSNSPAVGDFVIVKLDNDEDKWLKAKRCHDGWMIFWMDGYKQLVDNSEVTHYLERTTLPASLTMQQAREIAGEAWDSAEKYIRGKRVNKTRYENSQLPLIGRDTYLNSLNLPR